MTISALDLAAMVDFDARAVRWQSTVIPLRGDGTFMWQS